MNILFVYSFNRLWNHFADMSPHRSVFVTFRREYAHEPVDPLYVFSNKKLLRSSSKILSDTELLNSFQYTRSLKLMHGGDRRVIEIGRRYEGFYESLFDKEQIECIMNWNNAYGFQQIGHRLAQKLGIKTFVMEGGLFRPYTLSLETNGINAFSVMCQWDGSSNIQDQESPSFKVLKEMYFAQREDERTKKPSLIAPHRSPMERMLKELKQRCMYDLFDIETVPHRWLKRLCKILVRRMLADRSFMPQKGEKVFTFFLSSVYDPQLDIPTHDTITKHLTAVLEGFQLFRRSHPEFRLLIKEHPLDESRSLFWNLYRQNNKNNVRWTIQNSNQLISISDGVITINSTVGIDALMLEKPVLCLGHSCYQHEGITIPCSELFSAESVATALEQLATMKSDRTAVDLFLSAVYEKTQLPLWQNSNGEDGLKQGLLSYLRDI